MTHLVVLLVLLLAGCAVPADPMPADPMPAAPMPAAPAPAGPGIPVPPGAQEARVVRVVDGDTVQLRGRGTGPLPPDRTRVRVLLVDTPEVHGEQECYGPEASARMRQLLPEGATVRVQADRDPRDRFGRALLHVWNADGVNVGEVLLREGYARVLQIDPNERYLAEFERAEQEARRADRGLWAACR